MISRRLLGVFLTAALLAMTVAADEVAVQGRAIAEAQKAAVVTVQLVMKQQMGMFGTGSQEGESKGAVTGTVIDPTGLTVVSLTAIDPMSVFSELVSSEIGMPMGMNFQSEVISAKIVLEDGKELPASVVLRDPDLDLAFVRPDEKPAEPLRCVDLANASRPEVLDQVVTVSRLGQLARRTHSVALGRIDAVVDKPRTFYVPTPSVSTFMSLGSPVFALDGKIAGLTVVRKGKTEALSISDMVMAIVVSAGDVLDASKQAPGFDTPAETSPAEK